MTIILSPLLQFFKTSYLRAMGIVGGALLITGTCIGAGMLGLPVRNAAIGFYPAMGCFFLVWAVMTFTALAMLEVTLMLRGETNLISLAKATIGPWGSRIAWVIYLLFLYSVMAAYTSGGTTMLAKTVGISIKSLPGLLGAMALFVIPFALIVFFGTKCVDYINRILIFSLILVFSFLCTLVTEKQEYTVYEFGQIRYLAFGFPLMVISFGYHLLIPTLKTYLQENIFQLRWAIVLGSIIPFAIYIIWEYTVLSMVPVWGDGGLVSMLNGDSNPSELLIVALNKGSRWIGLCVAFFSFFALSSSFIGVALGLFDFFSDGLHIHKNYRGKLILSFLTFFPPVLYTLLYPQGFLFALSYGGIFAAALLVIYPALMAWYGRYQHQLKSDYQVMGGKGALLFAMLFGILVIVAELLGQLDLLPIPK